MKLQFMIFIALVFRFYFNKNYVFPAIGQATEA